MNLQEMQKSCEEFAKDLKTGGITWKLEKQKVVLFKFSCYVQFVKITLSLVDCFDKNVFFGTTIEGDSIRLKSTTAREAAQEALQLVKNEAEKLVQALS